MPAQSLIGKSSWLGPGNPGSSLDLYWSHGAEVRDSCPAPIWASHPLPLSLALPQTPVLTKVEGRVAVVGKIIDVGDAEGLNGHTAHAEQGLCCEHYPHHSQMLGLRVA